jgi:hypothetical protein
VRGERALLRIGEYLVARACRRLPRGIRDERYREWAAELPAILHDRGVRLAPYRAVRMLGYAADTLRATALTAGRARRRAAGPRPLVPACSLLLAWWLWPGGIRDTVRVPGDWVNYVLVVWSLVILVASSWLIRRSARAAATTGACRHGDRFLISTGRGHCLDAVAASWTIGSEKDGLCRVRYPDGIQHRLARAV